MAVGRLPAASWLLVSIALEAASVVILAATVGAVGSDLYSGKQVNWWAFALLMASMVFLRAVAAIAAGSYGAWFGGRYRRRALVAALSASPDQVRSIGPGAALTKAMDVESVGDFFARAGAGWILGIVEFAAALILAHVLRLPFLASVALAVSAGLIIVLTGTLMHARMRWRRARLEITARTVEGLLGLETTQVFDRPFARSAGATSQLNEYRRSATLMDAVTIALTVLPGVALAATLVPLSLAKTSSEVAIGVGLSLLAVSGLERLTSVSVDAVAALDAARGLRELESYRIPPSSFTATPSSGAERGRAADRGAHTLRPSENVVLLRAHAVTSTFVSGQGLVQAVDLVVREGDRLLISAPSGFGKTTFGEVLAGERAPTTGSVWHREDITVARVLQADDDFMFGNSLMFNVAGGVEWPPGPSTQLRVQTLLDELGLGELVRSMPAGLAQPVGEGGWRLSTGERTRVSIASALLREPDVLLLDESIAALDGVTRDRVLAVCARRSRSTVLFAHWD